MAKVFVTDQHYQAEIKLVKVVNEWDADLVVFVVDAEWKAENKDELWFYVEQEYQATKKIFWVENEWEADIKVFFTDTEWNAGWKKGNPWQGRLS